MAQEKTTPKGCYNCMKRRIKCDRTAPRCEKCAKKGIECPGYGIRYRFAKPRSRKYESQVQKPAATPPRAQDTSPSSTQIEASKNEALPDVDALSNVLSEGGCAGVGNDDDESMGDTFSGVDLQDGVDTWLMGQAEGMDALDQTITDEVALRHEIMSPMPPLEPLDAQTRLLFSHFNERVSPVMVLFDQEWNGYRSYVLPLAYEDSLVRRAICVVAALHLAQKVPELRAPAEGGRAAILSKLGTDVLSGSSSALNRSTWATILLLIVGDLVTGHADILVLHQMLRSFMGAMSHHYPIPITALDEFLLWQYQLFSFFAATILGETEGVGQLKGVPDPLLSIDPFTQRTTHQASARLYNEVYRRAAQIYLHRAQSYLMPGSDFMATEMLEDLRKLLLEVDPTAEGAHTLVWPYFIAAAESSIESHRQLFLGKLQHVWEMTGFRNVLVAIEKLPDIWRKQRTEKWTKALSSLPTVVM